MTKIILAVPETVEFEFVSIGNFGFDLKPGGTIELDQERRPVADWLIGSYGLVEVVEARGSLGDELKKLKLDQLIEQAKGLGIAIPQKPKKSDLIAAIVAKGVEGGVGAETGGADQAGGGDSGQGSAKAENEEPPKGGTQNGGNENDGNGGQE
jgi:hypothetical protein